MVKMTNLQAMAARITRDEKGRIMPGTGGRPPGTTNHLTKTVKETVLAVFNEIQEDPEVKLSAFAKKYPRDFYVIAAKLIPTEFKGTVETEKVLINLVFPDGD